MDTVGGIPVAHEDDSLFWNAVSPHQVIGVANISLDTHTFIVYTG